MQASIGAQGYTAEAESMADGSLLLSLRNADGHIIAWGSAHVPEAAPAAASAAVRYEEDDERRPWPRPA